MVSSPLTRWIKQLKYGLKLFNYQDLSKEVTLILVSMSYRNRVKMQISLVLKDIIYKNFLSHGKQMSYYIQFPNIKHRREKSLEIYVYIHKYCMKHFLTHVNHLLSSNLYEYFCDNKINKTGIEIILILRLLTLC